MQAGRYKLYKNFFSVGGDYTVEDAHGTTVMTFDGKLRFAATFTGYDAGGRPLFTGKEHVLSLDQQFEFERDGVPYATMLREMTSDPGRIFGSATYRFVARLRTGDRLETTGYVLTNWTIARGETTVARIETDGEVSEIELVDPTDGAFVITVVMAVARLNPSPNVGDSTD